MPNWVRNIVTIKGDENEIEKFQEKVKSDEMEFTFQNIIPMPEDLAIEVSGKVKSAMTAIRRGKNALAEWFENENFFSQKEKEEVVKIAKQAIENEKKYGFTDWFGWTRVNWGTKWDADNVYFEFYKGQLVLEFNTAWTAPLPIYKKMAEMFPELSFSIIFADEDLGFNCGTLEYENGEKTHEEEGDIYLSLKVWGIDPEDYFEEEDEN